MEDVYDGQGYKKHAQFLSQLSHVSLHLNTDGVSLYRSSKVSIWPVWAIINELPTSLRLVVYIVSNFCNIVCNARFPRQHMFVRRILLYGEAIDEHVFRTYYQGYQQSVQARFV